MVNFVIHDGESNWLQGLMLLVVYFLVAIAFIEHNAETGRGHPVFCCAQPPCLCDRILAVEMRSRVLVCFCAGTAE